MADIIDTAAEIEELQRNAALSAHRIDRNAVSAERCEECDEPTQSRGALPFPAARHARSARLIWSLSVSKGVVMCDMPAVFGQEQRKARKEHKCCECGAIVKPGEHYTYSHGVWDGSGQSFKQCLDCAEVSSAAAAFVDDPEDGPAFTGLRNGSWVIHVESLTVTSLLKFLHRTECRRKQNTQCVANGACQCSS
jgi:hypothetical protein